MKPELDTRGAVTITQGDGPIVLAQPHSGTFVPQDIYAKLNSVGRELLDTDWHIPKVYDQLVDAASVVRADFSRYVIDANRSPDGSSLYPGQNTSGLVPLTTFDGQAIWNIEPSKQDVEERITNYHAVYHRALSDELARVREVHGVAVLFDCHSIRSEIPFLFSGTLPHLNIGTNSGASCASHIEDLVVAACQQSKEFSYVLNGRFKGGWTTRHYGQAEKNTHAIQMEIAQRCYLKRECPPFEFDTQGASKLRTLLRTILLELSERAKQ